MKKFFNALWTNTQDVYFKVRGFIACAIAKTGLLQQADQMIAKAKAVKDPTWTDHLRLVGGYALRFTTYFVVGVLLGLATIPLEMVASLVLTPVAVGLVFSLLRVMFIYDLVETIELQFMVEKFTDTFASNFKKLFGANDAAPVAA